MNSFLYKDEELERMIKDGNDRAHAGRLERLRLLLSIESQESYPVNSLAWEYYQEARLCWYVGAFIATIVVSCIAIEELIRAKYRLIKGVGGRLDSGKKVDDVGLADLTQQATKDDLLTSKEARIIHKLRKEIRNPWVHPHDFDTQFVDSQKAMRKPNWLTQDIKLKYSVLVENEARRAIEVASNVFPRISRRFWELE